MITHRVAIKDNKEYYLCNQACNTTEEKIMYSWKNVTCKNCLKQRYKK